MRRILIIAAVSLGLLVAAEGALRLFVPGINLQGTDRSLLRENAYGASVGLAPNASGTSFGAPVTAARSTGATPGGSG